MYTVLVRIFVINAGTADQEFTVINTSSSLTANETLVNVKTFERWFIERIDGEMTIFVDTVEDRIQNTI